MRADLTLSGIRYQIYTGERAKDADIDFTFDQCDTVYLSRKEASALGLLLLQAASDTRATDDE